jgi:RNA polymerase sigma-70 factor (ECF subfamily)
MNTHTRIWIAAAIAAASFCAFAAQRSSLKYGDGKADGHKSYGGNGHIITFTLTPEESNAVQVTGIKVHGSRYGLPDPPDESFYVYLLSADGSEVLHTELAPYKLFERGEAEWVSVKFKEPVAAPQEFHVALDFKAHRTKGVYVSYDTKTEGQYSKAGLPGTPAKDVDFGGDWMVRVTLEARER